MRYLSFVILLHLSLATFSQNAMFLPFGQRAEDVHEDLASRSYLEKTEIVSPDLIRTTISKKEYLKYSFKSGQLYAIEDRRLFKDKKEAEETLKTTLEFLELSGDVYLALKEKFVRHYVSIQEDKIIELFIYPSDRPFKAEVHLKSTSRMFGPRMKTEAFISSLTKAE